MLRIDLTGFFLATRSGVRRMRAAKKKGTVIAISSVHAADKAGVKHFIETLTIDGSLAKIVALGA